MTECFASRLKEAKDEEEQFQIMCGARRDLGKKLGHVLREDVLDGRLREHSAVFEGVVKKLREALETVKTAMQEGTEPDLMVLMEGVMGSVGHAQSKFEGDTSTLYDPRVGKGDFQVSFIDELRYEVRDMRCQKEELEDELAIAEEQYRALQHTHTEYEEAVFKATQKLEQFMRNLRVEATTLKENLENSFSEPAATSPVKEELERHLERLSNKLQEQQFVIKELHTANKGENEKAQETLSKVEHRLSAPPELPDAKLTYREQRLRRLETIYNSCFRSQGMAMVWSVMQQVFLSEYSSTQDGGFSFRNDFKKHVTGRLTEYDPEDLHKAFASVVTLKDMYLKECKNLGVKANSGVLQKLSMADADGMQSFDLSYNLLGDLGLRVLLPIIQRLPSLQSLNLVSNGLQNESVALLAEELKDHPSVTAVDLSNNHLSRTAGKELIQLIISNKNICEIKLEGTRVDHGLRSRIKTMLEKKKISHP